MGKAEPLPKYDRSQPGWNQYLHEPNPYRADCQTCGAKGLDTLLALYGGTSHAESCFNGDKRMAGPHAARVRAAPPAKEVYVAPPTKPPPAPEAKCGAEYRPNFMQRDIVAPCGRPYAHFGRHGTGLPGAKCGQGYRLNMYESPGSRKCGKPEGHDGRCGSGIAKVESSTPTGTCQVCFRNQKCPSGLLSKHGYRVPHGYFEGVCWGASYAPYEVACERTKAFLAMLQKMHGERQAFLARLNANEVESLSWAYSATEADWRNNKKTMATIVKSAKEAGGWSKYGNNIGATPAFEHVRQSRIQDVERELRHIASDVAIYEKHVADWKLVPWPPNQSAQQLSLAAPGAV